LGGYQNQQLLAESARYGELRQLLTNVGTVTSWGRSRPKLTVLSLACQKSARDKIGMTKSPGIVEQ